MAENIGIKEFLDNPFSLRPLHNKLRIMNIGRPAPPLPNVITHHKTKTERCTRQVCISHYGKVDWLAGGEAADKLYCWPLSIFITNMMFQINRGFCIYIVSCASKTLKVKVMCTVI